MAKNPVDSVHVLIDAGRLDDARRTLENCINANHSDDHAWLLLISITPDISQKMRLIRQAKKLCPQSHLLVSAYPDDYPNQPHPTSKGGKSTRHIFLKVLMALLGLATIPTVAFLTIKLIPLVASPLLTRSAEAAVDQAVSADSDVLQSWPTTTGFFLVSNDLVPLLAEHAAPSRLSGVTFTNTPLPTFAVRDNSLDLSQIHLLHQSVGVGINGMNSDDGFKVMSVKPGSSADAAGLRSGNLILEIDGESTKQSSMIQFNYDLHCFPETMLTLKVLQGTTTVQMDAFCNYYYPEDYATRHVQFDIIPKNSYVLIRPEKALEPGLYYFRHGSSELISIGFTGPTATPPPPPLYWAFFVQDQ